MVGSRAASDAGRVPGARSSKRARVPIAAVQALRRSSLIEALAASKVRASPNDGVGAVATEIVVVGAAVSGKVAVATGADKG